MKNNLKIVTIGGGSSYTPELCEGIIKRFKDMPVSEWVLVDISKSREKNEIICSLVKRMIKKAGLNINVSTSYNLENALPGTHFVTTQLRVGLQEARAKDEEISFSHGMLGQETNGLGGQFKGMRTIPVILDIVKKVKKLANGAWIINFTNPSGMVTQAVNKHGNYNRFIGVCNIPIHTRKGVSEMLSENFENISVDAGGLNHLVLFNKFYLKGVDITKKILTLATTKNKNKNLTVKNISGLDWNPNFIKYLNSWPCSYHRYYYKRGVMLKKGLKEYKKGNSRARIVMKIEKSLFDQYKKTTLKEKPIELEQRGGAYYSDVACGVIKAIYTNSGEEYVVNVVNEGKISNLPNDWTVEVTSKIDASGASSVGRTIKIPFAAKPLIQQIKQFEFLTIEAVMQNSREKALLAAITNPLSEDDVEVEKAFDELMIAHKKYLPKFK